MINFISQRIASYDLFIETQLRSGLNLLHVMCIVHGHEVDILRFSMEFINFAFKIDPKTFKNTPGPGVPGLKNEFQESVLK